MPICFGVWQNSLQTIGGVKSQTIYVWINDYNITWRASLLNLDSELILQNGMLFQTGYFIWYHERDWQIYGPEVV